MMKLIILLCALIVIAFSIPIDDKSPSETEKYEFNDKGDKGYNFAIESGSSKREEVGEFRYVGGLSVRGSYEYVDDEGALHKVNYVADEKGYRPTIVS